MLRVFKMISMLKTRPRTIESLAESLDTTTRTIYRYIDLLEALGFIIDKDFSQRFFIHTTEEEEGEMHFNGEESALLHDVLNSALHNHPLKSDIMKKLFVHSDIKMLPDQLVQARVGQLVQKLVQAMKSEHQVILQNYHSAHSDTIRDRLVEPFDFGDEYGTLVAFDCGDKLVKQFKVERIGSVQLQTAHWKFTGQHEKPTTDVFGLTGAEHIEVELDMSLRAYLLMREEFPRSLPFLSKEGDRYYFRGEVRAIAGVGRFVLGLVDEIRVVKPVELVEHIKILLSKFETH